jgi:hypothetical protein
MHVFGHEGHAPKFPDTTDIRAAISSNEVKLANPYIAGLFTSQIE